MRWLAGLLALGCSAAELSHVVWAPRDRGNRVVPIRYREYGSTAVLYRCGVMSERRSAKITMAMNTRRQLQRIVASPGTQ